jgi:hypothetical protein
MSPTHLSYDCWGLANRPNKVTSNDYGGSAWPLVDHTLAGCLQSVHTGHDAELVLEGPRAENAKANAVAKRVFWDHSNIGKRNFMLISLCFCRKALCNLSIPFGRLQYVMSWFAKQSITL